jgi:Zn finger protein HypA/HybF involved in hydrogenase expression
MAEEARVVVLRCRECGDTFPQHENQPVKCPTCGSDQADVAGEPLL